MNDNKKAPQLQEAEYYDGINGQPTFEGLSQYCPPHCFELSGRSLRLAMDSGYEYELSFDRETVRWGKAGEEPRTDKYDCLKADDTTFFVNAEIADMQPRMGLSLILDDENALVTVLEARQGWNPKFPYLVSLRAHFGAVMVDGQPLNPRRHGYTADLVGKAIEWTYSPDFKITHVYRSERYYNIVAPAPEVLSQKNRDEIRMAHEVTWKGYEDPTEPALYIKVKEGMYIFGFVEEHMEKLTGPLVRGNSLSFLMNLKRMVDVGRSFGINGRQEPENYCFGAYGRYVDYPEKFKNFKGEYFT